MFYKKLPEIDRSKQDFELRLRKIEWIQQNPSPFKVGDKYNSGIVCAVDVAVWRAVGLPEFNWVIRYVKAGITHTMPVIQK